MITQAKSTGSSSRQVREIASQVPQPLRLELAKLILLEAAQQRCDATYLSLSGAAEGWVIAAVKREDPLPLLRSIVEELARQHTLNKPNLGIVLSERRAETLRQLLFGRSEKEVALSLGISRHTVHEHVKVIYRAYGVSTRAELMSLL